MLALAASAASEFRGHPLVSIGLVRGQMRDIAPWKPLASWRGKNAFTRDSLNAYRQRILTYYQDHGSFPERESVTRKSLRSTNRQAMVSLPHESTLTGCPSPSQWKRSLYTVLNPSRQRMPPPIREEVGPITRQCS